MNWLVCPHPCNETFQECHMAKDIPGLSAGNWSYGLLFSLHIFLNFAHRLLWLCAAKFLCGTHLSRSFPQGFCVVPSCQTSGSGGAIPASAAVMWLTQQDNSVPGLRYGAVPLHYHAWVRASAELASWSFKFSLNEKYLPSSAWDMKNFSHFLCCGSHPIPSRTAGCLNMFLYYDGNKQRKKINCVHRYYRMYFPTQIPNHIAGPVFWSVWIWGPKSLLMQMSK